MKKLLLAFCLVFLITSKNYCQTVIPDPDFGISTESSLKIKKVILNDTCTILDFDFNKFPGASFSIPSGTYIRDVASAEKLLIKSAIGVVLNKWDRVPESGAINYQLIFPPINKSVKTLEYGEEGGNWFIYNIQLAKVNRSVAPVEFQGNWFAKTTGDLEYVFLDSVVVINAALWKYGKINKQKALTEIELTNGVNKQKLYLKATAEGNCLIGESGKSMKLYSHTQTRVNPSVSDGEFNFSAVDAKVAMFKGYVKGFTPLCKGMTGILIINNAMSNNQQAIDISIADNGLFEVQTPILYPQIVTVSFPFYQGKLYLEPGKEVFQIIDGSNKTKSSFMGELAWENEGAYLLDLYKPDEMTLMGMTINMSLKEYKQYCLDRNTETANKIDSITVKDNIHPKVVELAKTNIQFSWFNQILRYSDYKEEAYRRKNNIPWNQEIPLEKTPFTASDLEFIKVVNFNSYSNLSVPEYLMFKYSLLYPDDIKARLQRIPVQEVKEQLKKSNVELTAEDYINLSKIDSLQSLSSVSRMDYQKYVGAFMKKYSRYLNKMISDNQQRITLDYFNTTLNINSPLFNDITRSRYCLSELTESFKPYSQTELDSINKTISSNFVVSFIQYQNNEIINKIEANKTKKGYIVNATPKYEGNKIFEAIIEKYKGKMVYVDFWATWCSPCLQGIKTIAPLKEELAGSDVVFLYITGELSPEGAWKSAIPDIKGEHYRLTDDEWNIISQQFNIMGIPHCALVDRSGNIVNPNLGHQSNEGLKKLLSGNIASN